MQYVHNFLEKYLNSKAKNYFDFFLIAMVTLTGFNADKSQDWESEERPGMYIFFYLR